MYSFPHTAAKYYRTVTVLKHVFGSRVSITAAVFILTSVSLSGHERGGLVSFAAGLSHEQKAAQVLMVNIPGSRTLPESAVQRFKGLVPGAVLFFGYNLAERPEYVRLFIEKCTDSFRTASTAVSMETAVAASSIEKTSGTDNSNSATGMSSTTGSRAAVGSSDTQKAAHSTVKSTEPSTAPVGGVPHSKTWIPPFFALDNEGGLVYRTRRLTAPLPSAEEIGRQFSPKTAEELYRLLGVQMQTLGLNLNLAPVAETQTAENAISLATRCYSSDKTQAGLYAAAAVRGMKTAGILSAIKHFPGNGTADLHKGRAELTADAVVIETQYADSFLPAVHAGAAFMLVSHITVPTFGVVPFCFSAEGIAWMRSVLHFSGVVLTDDIAMQALKQHGASSAENAVRAIRAGCDMVMCSEQAVYPIIQEIAETARRDSVFASRLDEAVVRILHAKYSSGLITDAGAALPVPPADWSAFTTAKTKGTAIVQAAADTH